MGKFFLGVIVGLVVAGYTQSHREAREAASTPTDTAE